MTLLLLAGTAEAREIAQHCADRGIAAVASLSGATRHPRDLAIPTRHGGFGGRDGFCTYLDDANITAILDATHPFATKITPRTWGVAQERAIPMLRYERPPWVPVHGDNWREIANEEDAQGHIPHGKTVFLATGRQTLHRFQNLTGRRVICRQIDPPNHPFPWDGGEFLIGRPPFSVQDEIDLFTRLGVDVLIVKNAGGDGSRSKLDAARALGIPVLMIRRPPPCDVPMVQDLQGAYDWISSHMPLSLTPLSLTQ